MCCRDNVLLNEAESSSGRRARNGRAIRGIKVEQSAGLPGLGGSDKAGGKLTDKDRRPLTSTLFLSSAAELPRGRTIEFVPGYGACRCRRQVWE